MADKQASPLSAAEESGWAEVSESRAADNQLNATSDGGNVSEQNIATLPPPSNTDDMLTFMNQDILDEDCTESTDILKAIIQAKRGEPNKFLSLWEDDEEGIEHPSESEIQNDPQKKILWAAENDQLDIVRQMLDDKPDLVGSRDSDQYTPLHRASYNGHVDMVQLLIARGADLEARTDDGWCPLHSACRWDNTEVASVLLHNGALINAQTNGHQTALHLAAANQDSRDLLALLLLNDYIDPSIKNKAGETAYDICRRTSELHKLFEITEYSINVLS